MKYYWVNQNQTYHHEVQGGYLWSPKTSANNRRNPFYDSMRDVKIGDTIFSFKDTLIKAIGIVTKPAYTSTKPLEFGEVGENWGKEGWAVEVDFHEINNAIRPKDNMDVLLPTLPNKYSPLQANGNGIQSVYLANMPEIMANTIMQLIGTEAEEIVSTFSVEQILNVENENKIEEAILQNTSMQETEKTQLSKSRRGQGIFRTNLERIEKRCRLTHLEIKKYLIASHIKPWRDSSNFERLDGNNGLLLSPHIDKLFDKGFISFSDNGDLIISNKLNQKILDSWSIKRLSNVGPFNIEQMKYLDYHRKNILIK
ncbi:HNH endonuclease [Methylophilaceae bacterium]|nr:HNH endonuclease [Methylophilaceae bacterium]